MLPERLKKYFWDCDFKQLDTEKNSRYIIERILTFGNLQDIRWLFNTYSKNEIKKIALNSRRLDNRTRNFWKIYFHAI